MKLRELALLTDQNIHPGVVLFLRGEGFDVLDINQAGLSSSDDAVILAHATSLGRIVLAHDADFGSWVISRGLPFIGIVYLRPGHVSAQLTIDSLQHVLAANLDLSPPFVLMAKRTGNGINIRVRSPIQP